MPGEPLCLLKACAQAKAELAELQETLERRGKSVDSTRLRSRESLQAAEVAEPVFFACGAR